VMRTVGAILQIEIKTLAKTIEDVKHSK